MTAEPIAHQTTTVPDGGTAPIRTAIIGYGTSGRFFHAPFLATNPEFEVAAIVTKSRERQAQAAAEHPTALLFDGPTELFDAAADEAIDLVVIGSPSETHADLADQALDAGLAVVVDKPFAVTAAEGRALIAKANRLGLALTVFQNRRFDGDFLTVRALIDDGALGAVHRFESRFEWWKPTQAKSWKAEATPAQGGGILYDLGTHLIDQAIVLFGDVTNLDCDVYAETLTRRDGGAADDDSFLALQHVSGVTSHLWMNGLTPVNGPRFRVLGATAGYVKWGLDGQEAALKAGGLPTDPGFGVDAAERWGTIGVGHDLQPVETVPGRYRDFYSGLANALLRGAAVPVDPANAVRVLEIIEHVRNR